MIMHHMLCAKYVQSLGHCNAMSFYSLHSQFLFVQVYNKYTCTCTCVCYYFSSSIPEARFSCITGIDMFVHVCVLCTCKYTSGLRD